jgi:NAD(P)-dependent dehydrogenase (short-subunit alcohol dehydrogenase family)
MVTEKPCILVTGSTDGIGMATALELVMRGATVIVHGRTKERAELALEKLARVSSGGRVVCVHGDFSSLAHVRSMADEIKRRFSRLNVLVNNAGMVSNIRRTSVDGYELTFAVNHLAAFLLTILLLDLILKSSPARIINVSSMVHSGASIDFDDIQMERGYSGMRAYSRSKLANILFTYALARRLLGTNVSVNALHPGVIDTKLLRTNYSGGLPPEEGAKTPVFLALSPQVDRVTGGYFVDRRQTRSSPLSYDEELQERLWGISEELTLAPRSDPRGIFPAGQPRRRTRA